jgi:hypothetical protein
MFPPIFCIPVPDADGPAAVFSSHQIRPRVYTINPYRILHGSNGAAMAEEAYAIDGRFGGHPSHISNDPLTLIAYHPEMGQLIFEGVWTHSGTTVFSMYCGAAIPMLSFRRLVPDNNTALGFREENGLTNDWFRIGNWDNHLPVVEGTRRHVRTWTQRWNPMSWSQDEDAVAHGSASGGSPIRSIATAIAPLPQFVSDMLIRDATTRHATCPITMEPIDKSTATATPCYHVFSANALAAWTASGNHTCPECRSQI